MSRTLFWEKIHGMKKNPQPNFTTCCLSHFTIAFFFNTRKMNKEEASKIIRHRRNLGRRRTFFSERYVYARWLKDFFLMDFEWYMETIYVHARVRLSWNVFEERIKHEWTRRDAVTRTNFERVESSCSWIIDYESHIFPRDHREKKLLGSCTSVFKCSTFFSHSFSVWILFFLLQKSCWCGWRFRFKFRCDWARTKMPQRWCYRLRIRLGLKENPFIRQFN